MDGLAESQTDQAFTGIGLGILEQKEKRNLNEYWMKNEFL